jgi:hypothetical protein
VAHLRRANRSQYVRPPLKAARWRLWGSLSVLGLVVVLAAAWWAGAGAWWPPDGTENAAWRGGRIVVLIFTLLLFLPALRLWMIASSAYKPGPVFVEKLFNAPTDPMCLDLTARFRRQISETDLYVSSIAPGEEPAESFLDLVGDIDVDPKNFGTSLPRLISRLRPRLAYRVSGVLQKRDTGPEKHDYGVTVTVQSFNGGARMRTLWGESWEIAVQTAADWVVAAILPVTRACRNAPWCDWQNQEIPVELFSAYQRAKGLAKDRHFDEALDNYYEALKCDPLNPYLRAEVASVQKRLGLYLDALESYQGALLHDGQSSEDYARRLWVSFGHRKQLRYFLHIRRRPDILGLRYRYAEILACTEISAAQWCKVDKVRPDDARARARDELRKRLTPALAERYKKPEDILVPEQMPKTEEDISRWEKKVSIFFSEACAREVFRLTADRRVATLIPRSKPPVTSATLRLFRDVLVPLRHARACAAYAHRDGPRTVTSYFRKCEPPRWKKLPLCGIVWDRRAYRRASEITSDGDPCTTLKQCIDPCTLKHRIEASLRSRRNKVFWRRAPIWQDHYNAACTYAMAMKAYAEEGRSIKVLTVNNDLAEHAASELAEPIRGTEYAILAECAVRELAESIRGAQSGFMKLQQWWILSNDPDLDELRIRPEFTNLEHDTYPQARASAPPGRGGDAIQYEMTSYDRYLVRDCAGHMENLWHNRAEKGSPDIHEAIRWLRDEMKIWNYLHDVSADEARHWPARAKLIRAVNTAKTPTPDDDAIFHPTFLENGDERMIELKPEALDRMLGKLALNATWVKRFCAQALLDRLEKMDETGTPLFASELKVICCRYAAVWQRLASWFDSPEGRSDFRNCRYNLSCAVSRIGEPDRHLVDGRDPMTQRIVGQPVNAEGGFTHAERRAGQGRDYAGPTSRSARNQH